MKIKRSTASIPLSCTGAAAVVCKGTLIETIRVKRHHKRVSEKVASGKFSIKAGAKKTVKLTLNKKGRKALGGFGVAQAPRDAHGPPGGQEGHGQDAHVQAQPQGGGPDRHARPATILAG